MEIQNKSSWIDIDDCTLLQIYGLADFLSLDVVINYYRSYIQRNKLIRNPEIFDLLQTFPYPEYPYNK